MAFLRIEWNEALQNAGKECTPENMNKIMSYKNIKYLEERSIELGWDLLNDLADQI